MKKHSFYQSVGKRVFDIVLAALALLILLPLFIVFAFVIRIRLGSPVLFKQERLGFKGRAFFIRKFRTMTDARDDEGKLLPDAERVSKLGQLLRATSLDELPELINILRGEMSLVGPRPLHAHYRGRYTPHQFRRHEVLPGLTGWAQVNGRNAISWEQKFDLDIWYVEHQSLRLDLTIIALTAWKVVKREGINKSGEATTGEFTGK